MADPDRGAEPAEHTPQTAGSFELTARWRCWPNTANYSTGPRLTDAFDVISKTINSDHELGLDMYFGDRIVQTLSMLDEGLPGPAWPGRHREGVGGYRRIP